MNREQVIQWAREAGILEPIDLLDNNQWKQETIRELERFAALVAAHEREECAKVCDERAMMERGAEKLAEVERKLEIAMDALKVSAIMPRSHEAHRRAVQALAQIGGNDAG